MWMYGFVVAVVVAVVVAGVDGQTGPSFPYTVGTFSNGGTITEAGGVSTVLVTMPSGDFWCHPDHGFKVSAPTMGGAVEMSHDGGTTWSSLAVPVLVAKFGPWGIPMQPTVTLEFRVSGAGNDDVAHAPGRTITINFSDYEQTPMGQPYPGGPDLSCYDKVIKPMTSSFSLSITDDQTAGIVLSELETTTLTEGTSQTFKVKLTSEPSVSPQTLTVSHVWDASPSPPPPAKRASVTPSSLSFTTADWDVEQTVTVTALQDAVDFGADLGMTITVAAPGGAEYSGLSQSTSGYSFSDDDSNGFSLSSAAASVDEGASTTWTMQLTAEPQGDVRVDLTASPGSECTVSPSFILYSPASYGASTITLTGVEDDIDDGDQTCTVAYSVDAALTTDNAYDSLTIGSTALSITDVDTAALVVVGPSVATINEDNSGPAASLLVSLDTKPLGTVTVSVVSSNVGSAVISSGGTLTFDGTDWSTGKLVSIAGVPDGFVDITKTVTFTVSAESSTVGGEPYDGLISDVIKSVDVENVDDPSITVTALVVPSKVVEGAGPIAFEVVLETGPTQDVRVAFSVDDTSQAVILGSPEVVFSSSNYSIPVPVLVQAVDNFVAEAGGSVELTVAPSVCGAALYNGVSAVPSSFTISVDDDDTAGVRVVPLGGPWPTTINEGDAGWQFGIKLESEPLNDVTVNLALDVAGQVSLNTTVVVIPVAEWNMLHAVEVVPIDELVYDGNVNVELSISSVTSSDLMYNGPPIVGGFPLTFDVEDNEVVTEVLSWTPEVVGIRQSPITISFDNPVLTPYRASLEGAFSLVSVASGSPVPVTLSWSADGLKLTATPDSELTELENYRIELDGAAAESMTVDDSLPRVGLPLGTTFSVVRLIAFIRPTDGATGVPLSEPFIFFFDQTMNQTMSEPSIHVRRSDAPSVPSSNLNGTFTWAPTGNVVEFQPSEPLEDTVDYTLILDPTLATQPIGSSQAVLKLSFTYTRTFRTVVVPPSVVTETPAAGAVGVALDSVVTIEFDEVMNESSVETSLSVWVDTDGVGGVDTAVSGSVSFSTSGSGATVATFTPATALTDDAEHEIRVETTATDVPGNGLESRVVASFRTVDLTRPQIVAMSPSDGTANVGLTDVFQITFSEPMNEASGLLNGAVELAFASDGTPVTVGLGWAAGSESTVLEVTPGVALSAGTRYTLTVPMTVITDGSGNSLGSATSVTFLTVCSSEFGYDATLDECACIPGFYGPIGGPCVTCPANGVCSGGSSMPVSAAGFAASPNNPLLFQACVPVEACLFNNTCSAGYEGSACTECSVGYYRLSQRCEPCPSNAWLRWTAFFVAIAVGCVLLLLGLLFFMRSLVKKGIRKYRESWASRMAVFSIAINFAQVIAILSSFELRWPSSVLNVFSVFSAFNFNVDLMATDCNVGLPYEVKWSIAMLSPVAVVFVLGLFTFLSHSARVVGKNGIPWSMLVMAVVALASFAYMFLAAKAVEFFDCSRQDDGTYLLDADPSLECYKGWWMDLLPAAIAGVVVYVVGIPLVFAGIMFKHRAALEDTRSVGFAVFGVISSRFRPHLAYYELVIMMRKLAILLAMLMVSDSPPVQAFIAQIALVFGLAVHQKTQPYNSKELNYVESALLISALCVLSAGQVFYSAESDILAMVVIVLIVGCGVAVFAVVFRAIVFRHTKYGVGASPNKVFPASELPQREGSLFAGTPGVEMDTTTVEAFSDKSVVEPSLSQETMSKSHSQNFTRSSPALTWIAGAGGDGADDDDDDDSSYSTCSASVHSMRGPRS